MTLDANGVLKNSEILGGRLPEVAYEVRIANGTLSGKASGQVEQVDPARVFSRPDLKGSVTGTVNTTFTIANLGEPRDSGVTGLTLDATGTLKNSEILGGRLPELGYEAHIANGTLSGKANGQFEHFDPARLLSRPEAKGDVSGTVNAAFTIANLGEPLTLESVTATGQLTLTPSTVGGLRIDAAAVDAAYANQVADVKKFTLAGPDVKADASGRVALDASSTSNLKYHVEAINLPALAKLANQPDVGGSAILDGTITGNRASLTATGTLDGSNLAYKNNNALDLDSKYTVTVPDLEMARARVQATTTGTFVKVGALEINELTATTTYADKRIDFTTSMKEKTRQLDATGQLILHPDHQELHLPTLAVRTQGIEWKMAPGSEATIKYGQERVQLENVRLVSADQSLDVSGTIALSGDAPSGDLDGQGAERRPATARNPAAAEPRLQRQADGERQGDGHDGQSRRRRARRDPQRRRSRRTSTNLSWPTSITQVGASSSTAHSGNPPPSRSRRKDRCRCRSSERVRAAMRRRPRVKKWTST